MKSLVILVAVLSCFVGIQAMEYHEMLIKGCIEDHGFNTTLIQTLRTPEEVHKYIPADKWICIAACLLERDQLEKTSPYKKILHAIETKDHREVHGVKMPKHDRQELIDTLNKCKAKHGESGCNFLKCLNIMEPPFKHLLIFNVGK